MFSSKEVFEKLDSLSAGKKRSLRYGIVKNEGLAIFEVFSLLSNQLQEIKSKEDRLIVLHTAAAYMSLGFKANNALFSSALGSCSLPTIGRRYTYFMDSFNRDGFTEETVSKFNVLITILRREGKTFNFEQFLNDLLMYREDSEVKFRWAKDFVSQQNHK